MMKIDVSNIGKRATICAVVHATLAHHACMIGREGVIEKAIASRNVYRLRLDDGTTWDSMPQNVTVHL